MRLTGLFSSLVQNSVEVLLWLTSDWCTNRFLAVEANVWRRERKLAGGKMGGRGWQPSEVETDGCKEKSGETHHWLHQQVFSTPTPGVLQCTTVLLLAVQCLAVSSHPVVLVVCACACTHACYSVTFSHVAAASLVSDLWVPWFPYITNVYLLQHRNSTTVFLV